MFSLKNKNISDLNEENLDLSKKHSNNFQDPFASLSPRLIIQDIISEGLKFIIKKNQKRNHRFN